MILLNPTDKTIEFRYGGKFQIFLPKESRTVTEAERKFFLDPRHVRGLVEYTDQSEINTVDMDYKTMPWRELIKVASARKLFKPGATREQTVEIMEDYDRTREIIQKPSN